MIQYSLYFPPLAAANCFPPQRKIILESSTLAWSLNLKFTPFSVHKHLLVETWNQLWFFIFILMSQLWTPERSMYSFLCVSIWIYSQVLLQVRVSELESLLYAPNIRGTKSKYLVCWSTEQDTDRRTVYIKFVHICLMYITTVQDIMNPELHTRQN